uniref:Uncharacterized protein n=1 Tax=Anopheles maculatus TaxID=74869 RepID=A0A182SX15_9DIPT
MMDVDQPVSSTTDNEKQEAALDGETSSQENAIATELPEVIVRENDDLPALLISDSEEEDDPSPPPSKAPTKEVPIGDISGISPIETTVANGQDDKSVTEETVGSETNGNETLLEAPAVCAGVDEREEDTPMENIDLTGASSADDSGVSEEQSGERTSTTTRPAAVTPKAQTKSSSEMTAQELLESLLDAQEEAFASHRASELGAKPELTEAAAVESKPPAEEVDKTDTASVKEKITTNNPDSSTLLQDEKDGADDNGTKIDTVVIDDECLLEEMSNAPAERQQEMDIDDHRTGSSNSSCSADGPNHISDGSEKANEEEEEEADEGEEKNDEEDSEEPPRKRARSMVVAEDSATETTTGPTSHGMEHGTVQNEPRSDGLANESGNLAKEQLDSTTDVNLSEDKPKSAADSLEQKSTTPLSDSCSSASANGGPLKKQCIEVGGQPNVKPVEPSVCPDVLVIDDDDEDDNDGKDDAAAAVVTCKSNLPQETDAKNEDAPGESKLKTDIIGDNTAKRSESDSSNEKVEKESIPMEFLRKFNKPLSQMTRTDLEQLVLQKITEAIVHRSENAELRRLVKRQSAKLQGYERTITDMTSQYEGLKLVAERAVIDMKKRAKSFIAPVKITRAVGLQVSRPGSDMVAAHRLSNFFNQSPDKRKPETGVATVTTTTNGAAENGEPGEVANHITQPTTAGAATVTVSPFPAGQQQNPSTNMNRSQFSNNKSPMNTPRFITTNPAGNGINRTMNQQIVRHNNSVSTANVNITLGGNALRFTANPTNDVSVMSTTITATVENVSPKTGSASSPNSVGGIDSPVRKFHKFTPKRPPLSAYQQAQQEKQAKQQQELLVQQIHEQSQQQAQQRKAQITM